MSRAPVKGPSKGSGGTRAFRRRQQLERERANRRRIRQMRSPGATELGALLRRVPSVAWIVALIAILNATAWSIITPPFQGRDEIDHFAYTARLAETGKPPEISPEAHPYPAEEALLLQGLHYWEVRFTPYQTSISTVAQQEALEKDAAAKLPLNDGNGGGGADTEPPLFYALQSIPYAFGGGNVLVKLQMMRLFDALLGGLTALLVFFFLRETVPAQPWAGTVAAICVALQPAFAFTTGSVNPDALLFTISATIFLMLARGFRRRLSIPLAVALGVAIAAGLITYFSFIGVAAGALCALVVLAVRDARGRGLGRKALVAPAIAIAIGVSPGVLDALVNLAGKRAAFGAISAGASTGGTSLWHEISYAWELFLPRLPGMTHYFGGISTWREIWFDRSVGFYGWMDTMLPGWVDNVALVLAVATALLCGRELLRVRGQIRARLPELASYALIGLATLAMLGAASYKGDVVEHEIAFGEPRYLLVLLPLFGAAIALAVRGAGRRWVPVVGAAMIVLFIGHDVFSQLQVIARYYG